MAAPGFGDRDAFGLKLGPAGAVVQVFLMRRGQVVERVELVTAGSPARAGRRRPASARRWRPASAGETDVLQAAIQQFYAERPAAGRDPRPVALGDGDTEMLEGWLSGQAGRRVRLVVPRRGDKRGLLDLAARNAALAYQSRFNENEAGALRRARDPAACLALPALPRRIECFDISTIQGSETVASMVVCDDGRMKRSEYRKFRIMGRRPASGARRAAAVRFAGHMPRPPERRRPPAARAPPS